MTRTRRTAGWCADLTAERLDDHEDALVHDRGRVVGQQVRTRQLDPARGHDISVEVLRLPTVEDDFGVGQETPNPLLTQVRRSAFVLPPASATSQNQPAGVTTRYAPGRDLTVHLVVATERDRQEPDLSCRSGSAPAPVRDERVVGFGGPQCPPVPRRGDLLQRIAMDLWPWVGRTPGRRQCLVRRGPRQGPRSRGPGRSPGRLRSHVAWMGTSSTPLPRRRPILRPSPSARNRRSRHPRVRWCQGAPGRTLDRLRRARGDVLEVRLDLRARTAGPARSSR